MPPLEARLIGHLPVPEGIMAEVELIEENQETHRIRCHCRPDGTTNLKSNLPGTLDYLNERYGSQVIWALCRQMTVGPKLPEF